MITRYAVRNTEGQWLRTKGYGGYGSSWTDDQDKARLYAKLGQARARRTFFFSRWPEFGTPEIVKFECEPVIIDDTVAAEKAKRKAATKKELAEVRRTERAMEIALADIERARLRYEMAVARVEGR